MQKKKFTLLALAFFVLVVVAGATCQTQVEKASSPAASYPSMAPLDQYLIPDVSSEIALARSAAPAPISDAAERLPLHRGTVMGRRHR
jgi:predicted transcriptional regulator